MLNPSCIVVALHKKSWWALENLTQTEDEEENIDIVVNESERKPWKKVYKRETDIRIKGMRDEWGII